MKLTVTKDMFCSEGIVLKQFYSGGEFLLPVFSLS